MKPGAISRAVAFLDSWLAYRARQVDIPGFTVAVLVGDEIVFSRAYGFANLERRTPLTTRHVFNMASQTKMFTAVAIMRLVQDGKLTLDDTACTYLPWLHNHPDRRYRRITIRHLLSHSSGLLRDGHDCDYWLLQKPCPTADELRQAILTMRLTWAPGAKIKYSNLGFALLGQIVEAAGGQPYAAYVRQLITEPLGLEPVYLDYRTAFGKQVPTGYSLPVEHRRGPFAPRLPANSLAPSTGLYATPETMCRFVTALFDGSHLLLNNELRGEMQCTQRKTTRGYDKGAEFGFGHEIQYAGGHRLVGHGGHVAGHLTATYFDPHDKIAVSVASNAKDAPSTLITRGIFGVLQFFQETSWHRTPLAASRLNARLRNEMSTVEVVASGKKIVVIDPDDWEPFAWYENLERIDDSTLRITTPGSIYNEGELVRYTFSDAIVQSVRFAGQTLLPAD